MFNVIISLNGSEDWKQRVTFPDAQITLNFARDVREQFQKYGLLNWTVKAVEITEAGEQDVPEKTWEQVIDLKLFTERYGDDPMIADGMPEYNNLSIDGISAHLDVFFPVVYVDSEYIGVSRCRVKGVVVRSWRAALDLVAECPEGDARRITDASADAGEELIYLTAAFLEARCKFWTDHAVTQATMMSEIDHKLLGYAR